MKRCTKCGVEKPLTNEYFQYRKGSKDGFRNECKVCKKDYNRNYREENKEYLAKHNAEYRKANWDSFMKNKKAYEELNRELLAEKRKKYYQKNKEQISKKKKEYTEKNKVKYAKYHLEYARRNVDKCKIKQHKRKAKLKSLPSTLTKNQWDDTVSHFNNSCAYCGSEEQIQQEHFVPLSKGGEFTHNNIIPACMKCNCSKQDQDFFEWYPNHKNYSKKREKTILKYLGYDKKIQQLSIL